MSKNVTTSLPVASSFGETMRPGKWWIEPLAVVLGLGFLLPTVPGPLSKESITTLETTSRRSIPQSCSGKVTMLFLDPSRVGG